MHALVGEAYRRFAPVSSGRVSRVYPALAGVPEHLFGIAVAGRDGQVFSAGDADYEFAIMSAAKPFVFALLCNMIGAAEIRKKIGVNATGHAFNSLTGIERDAEGRTNPMVNAGAIATTGLAPGDSVAAKWRFIHEGLSRFAGRILSLDEDIFTSVSASNARNRSIAWMLESMGRLYGDPVEAVDLYTRQSSLMVSARDLAVMGATLAGGGINPVTREQVVNPKVCRYALTVMINAGLYETSGDWLYEIGLPGKSGIGGGIVTVSPGMGGLGTFSLLLDAAGNSVRGQLTARFLSRRLGLHLLDPARCK